MQVFFSNQAKWELKNDLNSLKGIGFVFFEINAVRRKENSIRPQDRGNRYADRNSLCKKDAIGIGKRPGSENALRRISRQQFT